MFETVEHRVLLTSTLSNAIPTSIAPDAAPQELFAPGESTFTLSSPFNSVVSRRFRFTVHNASDGQLATFRTQVNSGNAGTSDAAIALYDASGNRIALADADSFLNGPGAETLSVELRSGSAYTVAFYGLQTSFFGGTSTLGLSVDLGLQSLGQTVRLDPTTGFATLNTSASPNAFFGSSSVRYFPLDFVNAGGSASVDLSPAGPDSSVRASLFRQTSPTTWTLQSTQSLGVGQSSSLSVSPPSGANVTDGTYLLAIAPLNFVAAPQPMNISVSTASPLTPSAVSPLQSGGELSPAPIGDGLVEASTTSPISVGQVAIRSIVAPFTGTMTVSLTSSALFAPLLAVYANNGTTLVDVASKTAVASTATLEFEAVAGTRYFLRTSPPTSGSTTFLLAARQTAATTSLTTSSSLATVTNLSIAPTAGARSFRLSSNDGARFIALELAPNAGSTLVTELSIRSANGLTQTVPAAGPGQPVRLVIDTTTHFGPIDVLVRSTAGTGTASLKHATVAVPPVVDASILQRTLLNLATGTLSTSPAQLTTGTPTGIVYYQPFPGQTPAATTFSATIANGATAILLHYVNEAGTYRLFDVATPDGSGVATISTVARGLTEHALVALPVDFSGNGTVQFGIAGPAPTGIGLSMVPNSLPGQPAPVGGFQSTASVSAATLESDVQRDLFGTQLPFNLTSTSSTLVFTPTTPGGAMRAVVNVFNDSNTVIATATTNAGSGVSIPVPGLTPGQGLRFEVRALSADTLGDGSYGLSFAVNTTDPRPFLVTQTEFFPFTSNQQPGRSYLPQNLAIIPINIASGSGSATSAFTSSTPYSNNGTGSIQVFEIDGATSNSPYQISTIAIDPSVNTNFAIFYFDTNNQKYVRVTGTAPSFDFFPADRTSVDARIVVNNVVAAPIFQEGEFGGPRKIYVVAMNEGGSRGQYRVEVGAAPVENAGPGNATPANIIVAAPRSGGQFLSGQQTVQTVNGTTYSLRTPSDMSSSGTPVLTVQTRNFSQGQTITVNISRGTLPPLFVGTYQGVVGAGGVANINLVGGLTNLGPNNTYNVTVSASSFPSTGLNLNLTVPRVTPTGTVPPSTINFTPLPQDAAYNFQIGRLEPAPNGSLNQQISSDDGVFRRLFSMPKAGLVSITINSAGGGSPAVGLYQAGKAGTSGAFTDISVLIDFDNTRNASNNFVITANLARGTYWLRGQGFDDNTPITITGSTPALDSRVLNAQPTTGITSQAEQTIINKGAFGSVNGLINNGFSDTRYATSFFKYTVPNNANGLPVSFSLEDFTAYSFNPPPPPVGTASLSVWKFVNNTFTKIASTPDAVNAATHSATISTGEPAVPGAEYFFGVNFNAFQYAAFVGVNVPVFQSGVADFSVQPVSLSPNNGSTLVRSSIVNASFTSAPPSTYTLQLGGLTSTRTLPSLAPFGSLSFALPWVPQALSDVVTVNANPGSAVPELSNQNNVRTTPLSSVNTTLPSATIQLVDANMTAEGNAAPSTGGGTWGRYISGVSGQTSTIRVVGNDAGNDLFQIGVLLRTGGNQRYVINYSNILQVPTSNFIANIPIDFGNVAGTTSSSPNRIQFFAIDKFGLRSPTQFQTLNVATPPSFLTGGFPEPGEAGAGGTITFDRSTRQFALNFQNSIVSLNNTLSEMLNFNVPFIGDKQNELLVAITGTGTASLNPASLIQLGLTGVLKLTALDKNLIDKSYAGNYQSEHISFTTQLDLDGRTLAPGSASATFKVTDFNLVDVESPLIPLFSYGAPGIAQLKAGIKFGFEADLNAAAKIGFDPTVGTIGGALGSLGVMSPTFIQPVITASATVVGEAEVLGFDIAELSGTIGLTLTVTLGLDNNIPGAIIPFTQAPGDLALSVHAALNFNIKAEVFWYEVYEYSDSFDLGNIVNTISEGIFLTDPPSFASGKFIGPPAPGSSPRSTRGAAQPTIRGGGSLVGAYRIDPSPQVVIDHSVVNGLAHAVQVVNVGSASAPLANLAFTTRTNGTWSSLATISQSTDVSAPALSLTHDVLNGAVVVYGVDKVAGSPSTRTVNERLNNQEIRYRYHDGKTWGPELSLTNDSRFDSQQSIAFDSAGNGVLAYVHNASATPVSSDGSLASSSNAIRVSIWNPATKTFSAPITLATGAGVNSQPTTFVEGGTRYVAWVQTSPSGESHIMYATQTGAGAWSTASTLPISGLPSGGTFKNVIIGSDGAGRLSVVFSHAVENADGSLTTALYQRPATTSSFGLTQPAVPVAQNATFSTLRSTPTPGGAMVVYWQESDGQRNEIRQITLTQGIASQPATISQSANIARSPSVAVDGDGALQVVFNDAVVFGGLSRGHTESNPEGAPLGAGVVSTIVEALPQPTFDTDLTFPDSQTSAPAGSSVIGRATIRNAGLITSPITITAYSGTPGPGTVVGQKVVTLAPGATYDFAQSFIIANGVREYTVILTTPGPQALGTTQIVSSVTVAGLADIQAVSLINAVPNPLPGTSQTLTATLLNRSLFTAPNFNVTLYAGDPRSPHLPLTALATQTVSALAGNSTRVLTFPVTLSSLAGDNVYTLVVDPDDALLESNEANNIARYEVNFRADPAVASTNGSSPITTTLLNTGNADNVRVDVNVANFGQTNLANLPINLTVSRNGGASESLGQIIIPSLAAGAQTVISFTVTARAGENLFAASIDPSVFAQDSNLTNNSAATSLSVAGLASLSAAASLSAPVAVAGTPLTLQATITNAGLADAIDVPYTVLARLTSGGPSYLIGSGVIDIAGLAAANQAVALNTSGLPRGFYTITFTINPQGTVIEDSPAGNVVTLSQTISTPLALSTPAAYVRLASDGQTLEVWNDTSPTGLPAFSVPRITVSALSAAASSGSQDVTIDFSNGNPLPGLFSFNAPAGGQNRLTVVGTSASDTFGMTGNTITINSPNGVNAAISRSNVGRLRLVGTDGHDVLGLNYTQGNPLPQTLAFDGTFTVNGLQTFANTTLDVERSTLFFAYAPGNSPVASLRQALTRGYNGGLWNGLANASNGAINTSAFASDPITAVGYADFADGDGINTTPNTVQVRFTVDADATLDRTVNFPDLLILARNYNTSGAAWADGDFNYDGSVDFSDLLKLARRYNASILQPEATWTDRPTGHSGRAMRSPFARDTEWSLDALLA